jgi:hypothetical protein
MEQMKFELSDSQIQELNAWKERIKKKHGSYGYYEYRFEKTGIGDSVKVFSHLTGEIIDLTEYDKW